MAAQPTCAPVLWSSTPEAWPEFILSARSRYNPSMVRVEEVVTQPYDKITPAMQQAYYQRSLYNLVRILVAIPTAVGQEARKQRRIHPRGTGFRRLAPHGGFGPGKDHCVFRLLPSVLQFRAETVEVHQRRAFIGLGEVCDYNAQVVFRHEQTLSKPKSDRLNL